MAAIVIAGELLPWQLQVKQVNYLATVIIGEAAALTVTIIVVARLL